MMQTLILQTTSTWRILKEILMPLVPTKARRRVNMTLEETLLQEDMPMVSRMQEAINLIKGSKIELI